MKSLLESADLGLETDTYFEYRELLPRVIQMSLLRHIKIVQCKLWKIYRPILVD